MTAGSKKRIVNSVDIVIPVFNEEANLNPLIDRFDTAMKNVEYKWKIVFVDDGSSDNSVELIRKRIEKDKGEKG